jgi:thioredoxin 1
MSNHLEGQTAPDALDGSHRATHERGAPDDIHAVSGGTFQSLVLDGVGPIVVELMSYGCGYCRALEPSLRQVAAELRGKVQFFRVNIGVEGELATSYEVQGTPTLLLFRDGQEIARIEGPTPSSESLLEAVTGPFAT